MELIAATADADAAADADADADADAQPTSIIENWPIWQS